MKKILITLSIFSIGITHAQKAKLKYADKLMQNWEYYDAAQIYHTIADKQVKRNSVQPDVYTKTAKAYLFAGNIHQADIWFTKAHEAKILNDGDAVDYFKVLMLKGKYEEALEVAKQYSGTLQSLPSAKAFIDGDYYITRLKRDSISYHVREYPVNSGTADFAPIWLGDDLYFISARSSHGTPVARFAANNQHFLKIMKAEKGPKDNLKISMQKKTWAHTFHDGHLAFSPDGKTAYLTINYWKSKKKGDKRVFGLYESNLVDGKWTKPVALEFNSSKYNVGHATISPDGNTMVFASDMSGGKGGSDIYIAQRVNGRWTNPQNLSHLNTDGNEMFPSFDLNGNLYFSSDSYLGLGGLDIYYSQNNNGIFEAPVNMGYGLNSSGDDFAISFKKGAEEAYFSSNRSGFVDRIYYTKIAPYIVPFEAILKDVTTGLPLENASVIIENIDLGKRIELISDKDGKIFVDLDQSDAYVLIAEKDRFIPQEIKLSGLTNVQRGESRSEVVELVPAKNMAKIKLVDDKTGQALPFAQVRIIVAGNNDILKTETDANGNVYVEFKPGSDAMIWASKKGYFDNTVSMKLPKNDSVNVTRTVGLTAFEKDLKLEIENIFYDYAKYTLRKESEKELDKVAEFLLANDNILVELGSHSDSRGNDKSNLELSQKRAESCVNYLISKGVPAKNIIAKGYGETQLVNRCANGVKCSEAEHQQNRRTELRILEIK